MPLVNLQPLVKHLSSLSSPRPIKYCYETIKDHKVKSVALASLMLLGGVILSSKTARGVAEYCFSKLGSYISLEGKKRHADLCLARSNFDIESYDDFSPTSLEDASYFKEAFDNYKLAAAGDHIEAGYFYAMLATSSTLIKDLEEDDVKLAFVCFQAAAQISTDRCAKMVSKAISEAIREDILLDSPLTISRQDLHGKIRVALAEGTFQFAKECKSSPALGCSDTFFKKAMGFGHDQARYYYATSCLERANIGILTKHPECSLEGNQALLKEAFECYRILADKGDPIAQFNYASLCLEPFAATVLGKSSEEMLEEARKYFQALIDNESDDSLVSGKGETKEGVTTQEKPTAEELFTNMINDMNELLGNSSPGTLPDSILTKAIQKLEEIPALCDFLRVSDDVRQGRIREELMEEAIKESTGLASHDILGLFFKIMSGFGLESDITSIQDAMVKLAKNPKIIEARRKFALSSEAPGKVEISIMKDAAIEIIKSLSSISDADASGMDKSSSKPLEEAITLYAAEERKMAISCYKSKNFLQACFYSKRALDRGDIDAKFVYAMILQHEDNESLDCKEARRIFGELNQAEHLKGSVNYATMLWSGKGLEEGQVASQEDKEIAYAIWERLANAEQPHGNSCYNLARAVRDGFLEMTLENLKVAESYAEKALGLKVSGANKMLKDIQEKIAELDGR